MEKKTIVVTGANGFLGRNVSEYMFGKGYEVIGLGHGDFGEEEMEEVGLSKWESCDITYDNLIKIIGKPHAIIHCAGSGSVGFSISNPKQDFEKTVNSTLAILEYCRINSPETKIVYPSSAAVYGKVSSLPINIDETPNPISPYGVHKLISEQLIHSYSRTFKLQASIIRFFSICGPGLKKQLLWDTCQKIKNGNYSFFGSGQEIRDWLHVSDAASLIHDTMVHTSDNVLVLNGGTGDGVKVEEIIRTTFKQMGVSEVPSFTGAHKQGDPTHLVADVSNTKIFNWEPEYNWKEIVSDYVAWFRGGF